MKLARRVAQLEGWLPGGRLPGWVRTLAAELAAEVGLDLAAIIRETEAILNQADAAGALGSVDDLAAFISGASGRAPEAILAEARQIVAR